MVLEITFSPKCQFSYKLNPTVLQNLSLCCRNLLHILKGFQDLQQRSRTHHAGVCGPMVRRQIWSELRNILQLTGLLLSHCLVIHYPLVAFPEICVHGFGFLWPLVRVAVKVLWSSWCSRYRNTNSPVHRSCRRISPASILSWADI